MTDCHYQQLPNVPPQIDHGYGSKVRILSTPFAMSMLARLSSPEAVQPEVNNLVESLYEWMIGPVADSVLKTKQVVSPTRMQAFTPHGQYAGQVIDREQKVVVVDIARAGMLPSYRVYHHLHHVIDPGNLRQDHLVASRVTDASDRVVGVEVSATKIGGPVSNSTVIIPDPMGATGTSIAAVIRRYKSDPAGPPKRIVAVHLIVTPEYLANITREFPEVEVFAIRLDRGLSSESVLNTPPGERWEEEVGLTPNQYIVPGAGGVGEVLNNAWI